MVSRPMPERRRRCLNPGAAEPQEFLAKTRRRKDVEKNGEPPECVPFFAFLRKFAKFYLPALREAQNMRGQNLKKDQTVETGLISRAIHRGVCEG